MVYQLSDIAVLSYSYFWHEALGNRGAIEIGTCVLLYLQQFALNNPSADIVLYSDNCGGQQKNRFFIGLYLYAVNFYNIKSITHKYLIRGHTQKEGNSIHSIIEQAVKRATKSGPIYIPEQNISLIRSAKKRGEPLRVKEMSFKDFMDLKELYEELGISVSKNAHGDVFKIHDVKLLRFEKNCDSFHYKTSYRQVEWSTVDCKPQKRRSGSVNWEEIPLKPAY